MSPMCCGAVILGNFRLFLGIHVLKLDVRPQIAVLGHQVVELCVGSLGEAHDIHVRLESPDDLFGLIGESEEFLGGEIEALVMPDSRGVHDDQE